MSKQEILPPVPVGNRLTPRPERVAVTVSAPRVNTGGPISSLLVSWEARYQTRAINAITERTDAEARYFDSLTRKTESYTRKQKAAYELQELPEVVAHGLAIRRIERTNERREAQHRVDVAEVRRQTEYTRAETLYVDARQQLEAQRRYGFSTYELAWKKKHLEMLEVDLSAAECREVLRQHRIELEAPHKPAIEEDRYRQQVEALADGKDLDQKIEEDINAIFAKTK